MLFANIDEIIDGTEKPQTNADCIRAMSDEDLARYITCPRQFGVHVSCARTCVECCAEWLKQPAEGEW